MTVANNAMNVPPAIMPPRHVRFHETAGAALSASVAIVDCVVLPPVVRDGVVINARRAVCCTYHVAMTAGRPSPANTSASGTVQSGSPMPTTAARARIHVAANEIAQMPIAFGNDVCCDSAIDVVRSPDVLSAASSAASTSRADCGRSAGSLL